MKSTQLSNRRAALKTTFGLTALGIALPSTWQKPVLNAVLLPAHAQTSTVSLILSGTPDCGSSVALTDLINLMVTVEPNPGVGASVQFSVSCNATPSASGTFNVLTAADGSAMLQNASGQGEGCSAGDTLNIEASYASATASCEWTMI